MGAKDSKIALLSYEDAVNRVTKVELARLQDAYKRACAFSGVLREITFTRDVLGDFIPLKLSQHIFEVMSSSSRGMTQRDLINTLVLLTRGKQEERLKLIYAVYADYNGQFVTRKSMAHMVMACEGTALPHAALSLFKTTDRVTYEVFSEWIKRYPNITTVTTWLLNSQGVTVSLTDNTEMPNFYQTLAGVTHLEESNIIELEKHYWTLKSQSKTGRFDLQTFKSIVCPPLPESIVEGLFKAFDENGDNHIDFKEISCGVSACCRGPLAERQKFCFKVFDKDMDGKLNENELKSTAMSLLQVKRMSSSDNNVSTKQNHIAKDTQGQSSNFTKTAKSPVAFTSTESGVKKVAESKFFTLNFTSEQGKDKRAPQKTEYSNKKPTDDQENQETYGKIKDEEITFVVSSALQYAVDKEGCLTLEEYQMWGMDDPLPNLFLDIVIEICHIVLGLRPLTPSEEGVIIRGWMQRSNKSTVKPGETWYVVASEWWNKWKKYVTYDPVLSPSLSRKWEHEALECDVVDQSQCNDRSSSTDTISSAIEASESMVHTNVSNHKGFNKLQVPSKKKSKSKESICTVSGISSGPTSAAYPGPIDNSSIIQDENSKVFTLTDEGGRMKDIIVHEEDFELLPEPVWRALNHWYGGQIVLPRIVPAPVDLEKPEIELYRLHVLLLRHQNPPANSQQHQAQFFPGSSTLAGMGNATFGMLKSSLNYVMGGNASPRRYLAYRATFSRRHTIKQVQTFLAYRLHIHYDNMRLWNYIDENNAFVMEEETATLEDFGVKDNSQILIEVRNMDMSWPEEMSQLAKNKRSKPKQAIEKGVTGLSNIGNTCFMNSGLQCISNTRPLTTYFRLMKHLYELNRSNPLGMKGHIAKRYGDLVQELWSGNNRSIAPLKFRWTISKYAPRFNGFSQHDSQELLAFLLDGLHEDLNRVQEKPYVELKDSDGRPDEKVAQEAWENHLMRNQSIIVDLFHGQIKSQVRCMECNTTSVRFDPFTFLSLPLPMDNSMYLDIILIKLNGENPVRYGLRLSMENKYQEVRTQLSELSGVNADNLLLTEVFAANIKTFISDNQKVRSMASSNLYAFEIPTPQLIVLDSSVVINGDKSNCLANGDAKLCIKLHEEIESTGNDIRSTVHESQKMSITNLHALHKEGLTTNGSVADTIVPSGRIIKSESMYSDSSNTSSLSITDSVEISDDLVIEKHSMSSSNAETELTSDDTTPDSSVRTEQVINGDVSASNLKLLNTTSNCSSATVKSQCYVIALHRKTFHQDVYFLSSQKNRMSLFGIPVMVPCVPGKPKSSLYQSVWKQVSRLVSPLPPPDSANHAMDCDDSMRMQYPFVLRSVKRCGNLCGESCPWFRFCRGCKIECNDEPYHTASGYIAIDWDPTALHLRYQPSTERDVVNHQSVDEGTKGQRQPIDLDQCLRAFTTEEELGADELYYCGKCKKHQLAKKKLDIWRLPPILIIHLKRFQFVNGHWIKSHKAVNFPKTNFDPSNFMTKRETDQENHGEQPNENVGKDEQSENAFKTGDKRITFADNSIVASHSESVKFPELSIPQSSPSVKHKRTTSAGPARKRQPSFKEESKPLFDLFALSCHSGILCGGHYISYAKNPNNKWYLYNDSSCKEVKEDDLAIDASYILFYERQGLDYDEFMPQTDRKTVVDTHSMDDDFNSEYKKYCAIQ